MNRIPDIPGYYIEKEIGHGGMGKIFRAIDRIHDRDVALKVFAPYGSHLEEAKARFVFEGEILSKLDHKNIVPVYDVGSYGDLHYIAVEYLEGKSLKERIHPKTEKRISVKESLNVLKEIAGALSYSHEKGLIHRDIKPENILFRSDNTPVLVDFGIAKDFSADKNFTITGTSIGTPYYMSPEQIKGLPPDERNDIYSLGVVLYEMLTGKIPYEASDIITVAMKHERDPIPSLPENLSYLQGLINSMMAKKSSDRPANGDEVIKIISGILKSPETMKKKKESGGFLNRIWKFFQKTLIFLLIFLIPVLTGYYIKKDRIYFKQKKKDSINIKKSGIRKTTKNTVSNYSPVISLRSAKKTISRTEIKKVMIRYNFFDSGLRPEGNFKNKYKSGVIKRDKVVIDNITGLMWHHRGSFKAMSISSAEEWLKKFNGSKYAGFSDWRLPTVVEGASLLEKKKWYGDLHIFSVFSVIQKEIWTVDINEGKNTNWIISFKKGRIRSVSLFRKRSFVRPVRNMYP